MSGIEQKTKQKCESEFKTKADLFTHIMDYHENMKSFDIAWWLRQPRKYLEEYHLSHHCDICGEPFHTENAKRIHKKIYHREVGV